MILVLLIELQLLNIAVEFTLQKHENLRSN